MREMGKRIFNSMKTGITLWAISHIILYIVTSQTNSMVIYNLQIAKLYNPVNFLLQLLLSGGIYAILELVFAYFVDNIFKSLTLLDKEESKKELRKNVFAATLLAVVVCVVIYLNKHLNIVNKYIIKIMFVIITIEVIIITIVQVRNTIVYNKKLKEVNKK